MFGIEFWGERRSVNWGHTQTAQVASALLSICVPTQKKQSRSQTDLRDFQEKGGRRNWRSVGLLDSCLRLTGGQAHKVGYGPVVVWG